MGDTGLEPSGVAVSGTAISEEGGAECGALAEDSAPKDHRLMQIVEAWDDLPESVRVAVVAMVEAVAPSEPEQV